MNNTLWFYSDTQQTYGPIAAAQLIAMIQAGQLVAGHFIMPQGAQEWQYVSASPFAGYLPQAAPPAPVAAPPPPQAPQRVPGQPFRPPQQRAAAPVPTPQAVKKSRGGLIAIAVVLLLAAGAGAYFRLKPATAAGGSSATASSFPTATKEKPFINSLGMKFVSVPGTDVLMCIHETRKQDFAAFAKDDPRVHDMWKNPRSGDRVVSAGNDHPVVCMSWYDADAFCDWLSKKEGRIYRLPTDHEWCLAAGIPDDPNAAEARDAKLFPTESSTGHDTTHPVMTLKPNKFGLFDLAGNVFEWCADFLPGQYEDFVVRGGIWLVINNPQPGFRQGGDGASNHRPHAGFRCVLAPEPLPVPELTPLKRVDGCVSYDPKKLKIMDRGADGWLLTDGTVHLQLLDNEADASLALAMAKEHTQRCIIGRGDSYGNTFEYWTGDSGIKVGTKSSNVTTFDASKFYIEKGKRPDSGWALKINFKQGSDDLYWFDSEERAKTALDAAKQHPNMFHIFQRKKPAREYKGGPMANFSHSMTYWE